MLEVVWLFEGVIKVIFPEERVGEDQEIIKLV